VVDSITTILLNGNGIAPNIIVTPNPLPFGDVRINTSKTDTITIQNIGTADLVISNFSINGNGFTLPNGESTITIKPDSSYELNVRFSPTVAQPYSGSITLTHNADGSPTTVQLTGNGVTSKIVIEIIESGSGLIDFRDVLVNNHKDTTFKITNNGDAELIISSLGISGLDAGQFTVRTTPPITIPPGGGDSITVRFSPTSRGEKNALLNIVHNGALVPVTLPLTGNGIVYDIRVAIPKNYVVRPNENIKISINAIDDLTATNAKSFSFVLKYNKRLLSVRGDGATTSGTMSSGLPVSTAGSTPGELIVRVTNNTATTLSGTGNLIDIDFIGLRGDSCGTDLVLESFVFNPNSSDGPNVITDDGYCELFGRCAENKEETYVTTDPTLLFQNNPNPVQRGYESTIQYRLNIAGDVNLTVYDVLGREVTKLVNEYKPEGIYSVAFNTKGLSSGVYFYKLRAPGYEGLKKMVVVK